MTSSSSSSSSSWSRLVRFQALDGTHKYGDLCVTNDQDLHQKLQTNSLYAVELLPTTTTTNTNTTNAGPFAKFTRASTVAVSKLLPLLQKSDVPIIRCIGLNYKKHIEEGGRSPPPYPSIFIKPSTCVAGFDQDIAIPAVAQDGFLDYEGELAIVISKPTKNTSAADALAHIAGYTVANDLSSRAWQRSPTKAGPVPQWCFSKGFDDFAPLGPLLVSPSVVGDASALHIRTLVNGELRQSSPTADLLFGVCELVAFASQGSTLQPGSVILTGTPAGVAMGMQVPRYLQHGDVVEVCISELGSIKNTMVFEK